jgi:RimJ/RimL family protein N-acetyltransferase
MSTHVFMQTPRLRLREFGPDDVDAITHLHREPRVRALLVDDYPLDDAATARAFIDALCRIYRSHEGYGIWHGEWKVDGAWRPCGWFNLLPLDDAAGSVAEIGCRLLPEAWGTGLPLECGQLLLNHAFESLALSRVLGLCHPGNRSVKLALLTLGFEPCGTRDYEGQRASQFAIKPVQWQAMRSQVRRVRIRQALEALRRLEPTPA